MMMAMMMMMMMMMVMIVLRDDIDGAAIAMVAKSATMVRIAMMIR